MPKQPPRPRRILFDRGVPAELKQAFPGSFAQTIAEAGWNDLGDAQLYAAMAGNFDVFLTSDPEKRYQQALALCPFTIVFVGVPERSIASYLPLFDEIRDTVAYTTPGRIYVVM
jgi:hypothetical protein